MTINVVLRNADDEDIPKIMSLLSSNSADMSLFQLPEKEVRQNVKEFIVAENEVEAVGCAAIHRYRGDLIEMRAVSVLPKYQGCGIFIRISFA